MDDARGGLADLLGLVVPDGDVVSFAEAMWLAALMPAGAPDEAAVPDVGDGQDDDTDGEAPSNEGARESAKLYDATPAQGPGIPVTHVAIDAGRALPRALEITRSLRPLKRRHAAGPGLELDLDATMDAYARTQRLIPSLSPARERWFDAVVVIDASPSMALWQDAVAEFVQLLNHTGAFRTVHRWDLRFGTDGISMRNRAGRPATPREAISSDGRRLILLLSDCTADAWREEEIWSIVRSWAASGPAALVTPLPPRLWRRTGMNRPAARVHAPTPGCANSGLVYPQIGAAGERRVPGAIPVPVISLEPAGIAAWANTLMCTDPGGCEAIVIPRAQRPEAGSRPALPNHPHPPIANRTSGFLATASDNAIKLATLCSPFSQVSFPLLLLLGRSLDRGVTATDIAEVVLSGLFTVNPQDSGSFNLHLHDEAKAVLAERLSKRDAWRSFNALTGSVEVSRSSRHDFQVALQSAQGVETVPAALEPFAQASQELQAILAGTVRGGNGPQRPVSGGTQPNPTSPSAPGLRTPISPATDYSPLFFLSHAEDRGLMLIDEFRRDRLVLRFYDDLRDAVRGLSRTGRGSPVIAAVDSEAAIAGRWSERVSEGLARCRVFVPLYSNEYFSSESCGREWQAFANRLDTSQILHGRRHDAIVPVIWRPLADGTLPALARELQSAPVDLGPSYRRYGMSYLLRHMAEHRTEYEAAVMQLARRIVTAGERDAPVRAERIPEYLNQSDAFRRPEDLLPRRPRIRIVIAAPHHPRLPAGADPEMYGENPTEWKPYLPDFDGEIASTAKRLAESMDFQVFIETLEQSAELKSGIVPTAPTLLIIDPWAAQDPALQQRLSRFDGSSHQKLWIRPVVAWNREHPANKAHEVDLEARLYATLSHCRRRYRPDSPQVFDGLETVQDFTSELPAVIRKAERLFYSEVARERTELAPAEELPRRPRFSGPGGPGFAVMLDSEGSDPGSVAENSGSSGGGAGQRPQLEGRDSSAQDIADHSN